jgi:hypothetical protein
MHAPPQAVSPQWFATELYRGHGGVRGRVTVVAPRGARVYLDVVRRAGGHHGL